MIRGHHCICSDCGDPFGHVRHGMPHDRLGWQFGHHAKNFPRGGENKFFPSFRDGHAKEKSQRKPLARPAENELIASPDQIVRVITFLRDDVRTPSIP